MFQLNTLTINAGYAYDSFLMTNELKIVYVSINLVIYYFYDETIADNTIIDLQRLSHIHLHFLI